MRHPEKVLDSPGHQRASHSIKQTDNSQRRQRTDVLRTKCRNDTGEEEARQGDILSNKKTISSAAHDIYIATCRRLVGLRTNTT